MKKNFVSSFSPRKNLRSVTFLVNLESPVYQLSIALLTSKIEAISKNLLKVKDLPYEKLCPGVAGFGFGWACWLGDMAG